MWATTCRKSSLSQTVSDTPADVRDEVAMDMPVEVLRIGLRIVPLAGDKVIELPGGMAAFADGMSTDLCIIAVFNPVIASEAVMPALCAIDSRIVMVDILTDTTFSVATGVGV